MSTNCTRSRKLPATPLSEAVRDILWERRQADEARFAEARCAEQERRLAFHSVEAVAAEYDFARDEAETLLTADGAPLQLAMTLTRRADPAEAVTVLYRADSDEWLALLPVPASHSALAFIAAVQDRVQSNKAARLAQTAEKGAPQNVH